MTADDAAKPGRFDMDAVQARNTASLSLYREGHIPQHLMDMAAALAEIRRYQTIVDTPELDDFIAAVVREAEHARGRWEDEGKGAPDWFWLVGYLAGKALSSWKLGDVERVKHHIITTAGACLNWHAWAKEEVPDAD